ncbi:hypothetical protein BDW75DRAFT_232197 [Aspergillus navahoensis]
MDGSEAQRAASGSIGQFSFAPATQTTVVTTTTTTTTTFPPLFIKPPRTVRELDPKLYPLASSPTPSALKNIRFDIGGKSVVFNEPDDTKATIEEITEKNDALRASNGVIRSVTSFCSEDNQPPSRFTAPRISNHPSPVPISSKRRPLPLTDSRQGHLKTQSTRIPSEPLIRSCRSNGSTSSYPRAAGLATPETESSSFSSQDNPSRSRTIVSERNRHLSHPPVSDSAELAVQEDQDLEITESQGTEFNQDVLSQSRSIDSASQPTLVDNVLAQDMCLPSPSLSPVAAMNAMHAESSFDSAEDPEDETDSSFEQIDSQLTESSSIKALTAPVSAPRSRNNGNVTSNTRIPAASSLMDIPNVVNFFDSMPDEMKTYLMYQLLKRCPKPTLHFVADVVNPALKCDFLTLLPPELSLNIVKYFDAQTMCRAAQVSKKWRHIINSDEKSWKELFDRDGFTLPEGELQRAIREGWGWQFPNGLEDYEKDLSLSPSISEPSCSALSPLAGPSDRSTSVNRRPKRKANTRVSSRKLAKRKISSSGTDQSDSSDWKREVLVAEGPYAAANAAAAAVPYPDIGLPSLRGLHLYKSLYQRHYCMRKGWMKPGVKPRHIAFRAHDRHVVTCLQFDTDKILTGSDDTNINVYDTKTGVLRATLEGHEGGVWALEYYGNTLVSGSTDRSVRVWDIDKARCTQIFHGHTSTVRCLQIVLPVEIGKKADGTPDMMPKEPLIITGSRDSNLRVWKLPKPGDPGYYQSGPHVDDTDCPYFVRVLTGHQHSVRAIAAHGDTLVSGSYDCTVRVWKISTGETVHRLSGHSLKVYSVVLDHKRNRCISGSMDNMVKVWSLETGSILYNLEGHTSLVGLLDLKCDRLVSAAADSTLRIWDPETGQCKSMLSAHTGAITCFQHDGQKVISGSDRTLKMWDIRTGECVRDLLTNLGGVWQIKFNDRRCVAAVQRDGMTYIEVLDFGASRDGFPEDQLGRRIVVNRSGQEVSDTDEEYDLSDA